MSPPETMRDTPTATAPPEGAVPLLALVLTGALRLREHPTEAVPEG